jgi:hypothetical protein
MAIVAAGLSGYAYAPVLIAGKAIVLSLCSTAKRNELA